MDASSRQRPPGSGATHSSTRGGASVRAGARASSPAICARTAASLGHPGGADQRTSGIAGPGPGEGAGARTSAAHVMSASIGGAA